jgi:hypothetical protein
MPPQNCFEGLVDQSISLRYNVEGLEQQVAELYERLQEARIESQTKDKYVTLNIVQTVRH